MRQRQQRMAIVALRWVLGLVLGGQAAALLFYKPAISAFTRTGLPQAVRLALALSEIVAAPLF